MVGKKARTETSDSVDAPNSLVAAAYSYLASMMACREEVRECEGCGRLVPANARSPKILRKELLHAQAREQASEAESYLISVQLRCGERNRQRERRAKEAAEI
jgi:hypothetical protein